MKDLIEATWRILNQKWLLVFSVILLTAIYTTKADRNFGWTKSHEEDSTPVFTDGAGYYAWLPEWYIYRNDLNFLRVIKKKYPTNRFSDGVSIISTRVYNKFYIGTAVASSPFFGLGHMIAGSYGVPQDGYSWPYLMTIVFSGIFYFFIGLIAVALLLRAYGIDRFWIIVCLIVVAFGSNLGYYVYEFAPFSHVYSFAFCSLFLLFAKRWADSNKLKNLALLAFSLGMVFLIRPTDLLIVLIVPFLFADFTIFWLRIKELFTERIIHMLTFMLIFGGMVFFQLYTNHGQTGKWSFDSYEEEKFEFLTDPKITEVLFGFRKGLFVYSPALLLFFPGMFFLYRRNKKLFWGITLFFAAFTYLTASWWCWWYGGGLGMRPYLDSLIVLVIPIAFMLQYSRVWLKILTLVFVIATCWIGLIFQKQLHLNILHYDDMNAEKFKRVFLHTEERYKWAAFFEYDKLPEAAVIRGSKLYFGFQNKPVLPGRTISSASMIDYQNLTLIQLPAEKSERLYAAKINAEILLHSERTNPGFDVRYYKGGDLIKEDKFFIGCFLPKTGEFITVSLDIYPGLKLNEIDSVKCVFDPNVDELEIRNVYLQPYSISLAH